MSYWPRATLSRTLDTSFCGERVSKQRGLLQEPIRDLVDGPAADRLDAGNRQEIGDRRAGRSRVGALDRGEKAGIGRRTIGA